MCNRLGVAALVERAASRLPSLVYPSGRNSGAYVLMADTSASSESVDITAFGAGARSFAKR